jgi:hypothetical protein
MTVSKICNSVLVISKPSLIKTHPIHTASARADNKKATAWVAFFVQFGVPCSDT